MEFELLRQQANRKIGSGSVTHYPAEDFLTPAIRGRFETTYLAGLRKAGVPEE